MGKIRFIIALWIAKFAIVIMKLTHFKGTNFPGVIAIKICPEFLKYIGKPTGIIGVTGTNGKTTVSNLIIDMLEYDGKKVLNNNYGSNINTGIATSFIRGATIFGKTKYDIAVLEIDERSALRIFPYIKPQYLIITNLFRDSIMRNAHPEYIADILTEYIPKETKLILNGDDIISCNVAPDNERVYFGIDKMDSDIKECINLINDIRMCPKCYNKLEYDYLRYHHIGKVHCTKCDFKSPDYDYYAKNVDIKNMTMDFEDAKGSSTYKLLNQSIFNIYNMVTAISLFRELGYGHEDIGRLIDKTAIVKSRYNADKVGDVTVINQMAKDRNALGSSRAFDFVSHEPGTKELILMMNNLEDEKKYSENTCWLYDCDFEFLNNKDIKKIVVTGPRCKDYVLRLQIAGVPEDIIQCTRHEIDAPDLLSYEKDDNIYVLFGTDSLVLGNKVLDKIKKIAQERSAK